MTSTAQPTRAAVDELLEKAIAQQRPYIEFLRVPDLSAGLLHLPPGAVDRQTPHREDELYHIVRGRARFEAGGVDRAVAPGDLLFVRAGEPHHFHSVEEDLVALAVFGPAESEE